MCEKMISLAEKKQFHIMEGDKVPSQDLRLREIDCGINLRNIG